MAVLALYGRGREGRMEAGLYVAGLVAASRLVKRQWWERNDPKILKARCVYVLLLATVLTQGTLPKWNIVPIEILRIFILLSPLIYVQAVLYMENIYSASKVYTLSKALLAVLLEPVTAILNQDWYYLRDVIIVSP
jgi:hypothetical protein